LIFLGLLLIDSFYCLLGAIFLLPELQTESNSPTKDAAAAAPALKSIDIGATLPTLTLNNAWAKISNSRTLQTRRGRVVLGSKG
jgi:hypothetical protein